MGEKIRKYHSASFKAKVALEALKERETINQIASKYEIHPNLVTTWKGQLLDHSGEAFVKKRGRKASGDTETDSLYQQIGKLKVENDWLKKKYESIRQ